MSNYRIKIQYDGSRYRGWQRQQGEKNTIQGRIEQVLSKQMGFPVMDKELDVVQMRQAVEKLVGEHDFKGFCTKASRKKSTVRNLYDITITEDENRIYLTFYGSGFLYNMVRILTGTLVEIGMGERTVESIDEVFTKKERALAGVTAPAKGLTLVRVLYD